MRLTLATGLQSFEKIRTEKVFYIDKSNFIKEWWDRKDDIALIIRPRRFGKTLNISMLECFFSTKYAGRGDLFEGVSVWDNEKYRELQGTYPVINLSFAQVKSANYEGARNMICQIITQVFKSFRDSIDMDRLDKVDKEFFVA